MWTFVDTDSLFRLTVTRLIVNPTSHLLPHILSTVNRTATASSDNGSEVTRARLVNIGLNDKSSPFFDHKSSTT